MLATPLVPGFLYHVKGCGLDLTIVASHGCDAICIALNFIKE